MFQKFIKKLEKLEKVLQNKVEGRAEENTNWVSAAQMWGNYSSPFRPSLQDLENYALVLNFLENKSRVLLFGATPELRDLLMGLDLDFILVDFSTEMLKGMQSFCSVSVEQNEKWIKADWMEIDKFLKNDYFDLALGDLVLRNVEPEKQSMFLEKISNLLTKNGYFITRIHFINESILDLSPKKIIREVFDKNSGHKDGFLEDLIASRLFDKCTNFEKKIIDKKLFFSHINTYLKKEARNRKEKRILKNVLKKWLGGGTWTQRKKVELKKILEKNFLRENNLVSYRYPNSNSYPLYVLKNK